MKPLLVVLFSLACLVTVRAQIAPDSVEQKLTALSASLSLDSLKLPKDSLKLPQVPDSLRAPFLKADSIRIGFIAESSKLKNQYDSSVSGIDQATSKINSKIDSLQKLGLPTNKLTTKLDSLNQERVKTKAKFDEKTSAIKARTTDKLKKLDLPPQYNEPIQKLTSQVDGFNIDSKTLDIPGLDLPGYDLPKVEGLGDVSLKNGVPDMGSLPKVETPIGDLGQVGDQVKNLGGDIKNISEGNLNEVKEIPKTIEQQAGNLEGMDELKKQTGEISEYQDKLKNMNDPEAMKKEAADMAKKAAIDHFAGKEEALKKAMDQMSKYKQKYSSVSSIKDLPKRPPNAMKGKPFIERVVPGLYFQFQQKNHNLYDFNPYVGYRISGRFTSGMGWNHRIAYDRKHNDWNKQSRIFGPRAYLDAKVGRGFIAHIEGEYMNTFVPFKLTGNPDEGSREWVWSLMTGLKKEYKIYKNLNGTILLQYNIFNPKYKSPYVDRLNSRIGFEYKLKKKVKPAGS